MTGKPLSIAFLWHMHQPYYKDPLTGVYKLPWVRLHGVKDYLDMIQELEDFPSIRQTFNVVPSLLLQLNDYLDHGAQDQHLQLTLKDAADLNEREALFILENFFLANWDTMIKPFPRYYELLSKRGARLTKGSTRIVRYFSEADLRDIQVLFNLSWIDPMFRNSDPFLKSLEEKGRDFTEEEKKLLIEKQFEIMRRIIPEYKKMALSGQVELSVTPFYHPILPLLCDTDSARMAMPSVRLPKKRFMHPEDAQKQIRMALDFFEKTFGYRPAGMWPSEGSVSEQVLGIMRQEGIQWAATDEEVLAGSLLRPLRSPEGYLTDGATLFMPHQFNEVSLFFRDHKLSDLIGFVYSGWDPVKAADDFIGKLASIQNNLPKDRPFIVPIILDGENAWEYYRNDGHDFLRSLYTRLGNDHRFRTVTFSDFLKEHGPGEPLKRLHAGSWISANFSIWIGHEEDNLAWDYLTQARDDLAAFERANPGTSCTEAWEAIYAAEGSDWNWWYGDEHTTETQEEFDELFRRHLMRVYQAIGKEIPPYLHIPILLEDRSIAPTMQIRGFIHPVIDGAVTSYFEWHQAAYLDVKRSGGSMHKAESFISKVYYGFDKDNLYLRVDPVVSFSEVLEREQVGIHITIVHPSEYRISCELTKDSLSAGLFQKKDGEWIKIRDIQKAAADTVFEIEIPFSDVAAKENDQIDFSVDVTRNGGTAERCPWRGYIAVTVPVPYYETMMWY